MIFTASPPPRKFWRQLSIPVAIGIFSICATSFVHNDRYDRFRDSPTENGCKFPMLVVAVV